MKTSHPNSPSMAEAVARGAALAKLRSRRKQRGAAVFVIAMVLTLLTGLGLWATRSASLVDVAAGNSRQALQAQYVADLGVETTTALLAAGLADKYVNDAKSGTFVCKENNPNLPTGFCYLFYFAEIESSLDGIETGAKLISGAHATNAGESSLGPYIQGTSDVVGDFVVEMTDLGPAGPLEGTEQDDVNSSIRQASVVFTSIANVRPNVAGADPSECDTLASSVTDRQMMRASAVVAPLFR